MAEPLKNIYNQQFLESFSTVVKGVHPDFRKSLFLKDVFDSEWKNRELKQRMRHIVLTLKAQLPDDYRQMVKIVLDIVNQLQKERVNEQGFEWMFLPEFIELYGLDNYAISVSAFERLTQFTSCEFAVRPFIIKYPTKMMQQMTIWSKHQDHTVRRLSSEGCRPRLPWAMALPKLKSNPKSILPVLENLRNDKSEYVRRSVANNLNDISKDNPDIVIKIAKKWIGKSAETDKLIKHACRTLLKQGNTEVLRLFGFSSVESIHIRAFRIHTPKVRIETSLVFSFQLSNKSKSNSLLRLEYAVYYQKANGSLSKKVYKISEKEYEGNSVSEISRKQSFRLITTRKFHLGLHQISLIINGVEYEKLDFELIN